MLAFDWTISVGNLITAGVVVGGWFYAFFQLKGDVRIVRHDMATIKQRQEGFNEALSQLTAILTKVAVQEERFASQEHRIEVCEQDVRDLQSGIGFKEREVSGEYMKRGKVSKI